MSEEHILTEEIQEYKTVYKGGEGEIVEKKSRFIAAIHPVETEAEALAFIEAVRKKHWDARHHCYAYIIGEKSSLKRMSDDGEPGGTAGKPMLDILQGECLTNVAAVVTRYFGGTLLGTGGLARAYSSAVREGLSASTIITKIPGCILQATVSYTDLGKVQYILASRGVKTLDSIYTDRVELEILSPWKDVGAVITDLNEATNGKADIQKKSTCFYAETGSGVEVFQVSV